MFHGASSLSGITASSESLIFAADGAGDDDDEGVSSGDYGVDGSAPWYLRVQELAHDSLIAATRAQLARDAKASQDARAASVSNGEVAPPPSSFYLQKPRSTPLIKSLLCNFVQINECDSRRQVDLSGTLNRFRV